MGDTSEAQALPTEPVSNDKQCGDGGCSGGTDCPPSSSQPNSAIDKNVEKASIATDDDTPAIASATKDAATSKSTDDDQTANAAALSDQDQKFKSKLLESEAEQRNTSTSNAGESEYESANEEDIADFESTPEPEPAIAGASNAPVLVNTTDNVSTTTTTVEEKTESNVNGSTVEVALNENFDKLNIESDSKNLTVNNNNNNNNNNNDAEEFSSLNDAEANNDLSEELPEDKVLSRIRRRKRRSKQSDDDTVDDDEEYNELSDEEATEDIDDEEESFDEAEEGQLANEVADAANTSVVEDERENGDGQESENQDSKSKLAKVAKKGEIEDKRNPQYIPRKGPFYEHDDRINEADKPKETPESGKVVEGEESEAEKLKSKKRLMATMKLRSDEMADDEAEADQLSSKSVSKEMLQEMSSSISVEALEKASTSSAKSFDSKSPRETSRKKPLWDGKDRWSHDKFNMDEQKPKSREELINSYGYDIRDETDAPKLQRRSKYGKGPQKYTRRSIDDDSGSSFAKRSLRKVILRSPRESKPEDLKHEENEQRDDEKERIEYSQPIMKKDQVFNNRHSPKDRKVISKEPSPTTRPSNFSSKPSNYLDSTNRVHENRVFVNKSGQSSKFVKNEKPRINSQQEHFREGGPSRPGDTFEMSRRENVHEQVPHERSKELFTNEDFPELVSALSKGRADRANANVDSANGTTNKNKVIYYQHPTAAPVSNNKSVDSKHFKDTHLHGNAAAPEYLRESNYDSLDTAATAARSNQSMPVLKSQMYENSRFSRSRNYGSNHEYSSSNNWNNNNNNSNNANPRSLGPSKPSQYVSNHQQPLIKKQPIIVSATNKEEPPNVAERDSEVTSAESRPKRYSSIRQQQQRTVPVPSNPGSTHPATQQPPTYTSVSQTTASSSQQPQPQYISLNADGSTSTSNVMPAAEVNAKNTYYDTAAPVNTNEIPQQHQPGTAATAPNMLANTTGHHLQTHAHNYGVQPINGPSTGATATGTAYIPAATPIMAYYDPNTATVPAAAAAAAAAAATTTLQTPLGLTQAYFTTDQTGTAQTAPNYYLTTADLTAVAYHPAYHLQTNYPQQLSSHHTHQSHVTNRYLNTTPANAPSAESNRYLQTAPSTQNTTPILVTGQAYQPAIQHQPAYPSGYPQFPPTQPPSTPALGTSSPLPAGFPNVPLATSNATAPTASTQQQTPSGYPELYRGGITYYDIQSQQQAMQRQLHHNITQQGQRGKAVRGHHGVEPSDNVDGVDANAVDKGSKHPSAKSEISVSN